MTAQWIADARDGADLRVRLTTRASRDALAGERAGRLQVRVTAPPVDGRANAAACKLLAKALGTAKSNLAVVAGAAAREKTIHVAGMSAREVHDALAG